MGYHANAVDLDWANSGEGAHLFSAAVARHVDVATSIKLGNREQKQGLEARIGAGSGSSREQEVGAQAGINKDDDGNRMTGSSIRQSATGRRSIPRQQAERWEDGEEENGDRSGREEEWIRGEGEGEGGRSAPIDKEEEDSRRRRLRSIFCRREGRWEESEEEKGDRCRSTGRKKGFKGAGGRRQGEVRQREAGDRRRGEVRQRVNGEGGTRQHEAGG
ncbi:hypothetical protein ACLOJK_021271 [Asimina triloba]